MERRTREGPSIGPGSRLAEKAARALLLLLVAWLVTPPAVPQPTQQERRRRYLFERPNIAVVVLDDVGVDLLAAYGEGPEPKACTPGLDALAAGGLVFRNAWADPTCSPTRAQILTGRHAFRTGIGGPVNGTNPPSYAGLSYAENTIAEALGRRGYSTAFFGKWHLATQDLDPGDPLRHGFQWFEGGIKGQLAPEGGGACPTCPAGCQTGELGYYRWVKSTNGIETCDTRYATTATVDDALGAVGLVAEPWFIDVSFHAIHSPYHVPPSELCPGGQTCTCTGTIETIREKANAALEAVDRELERLITTLKAASSRPLIVFVLGDNGTPSEIAAGELGGCFDPQRSKGTLYEGGVNVPLIVWGDGVVPGEVGGLVCATDLFATVAELGGSPARAEDSVSLVRYFDGRRGAVRSTVYAERFTPNGLPFAPTSHQRAIRNRRFKLIRATGASDELYDLVNDPCETQNLFPSEPGSAAGKAWAELDAELGALGVGH